MTAQLSNPIADRIIDIIADQVKMPKEQIVPEASFSTDLGFDSLEQVEFIMAIEEAFNIEVPDEDAEKIQTVQQAITNVEQAMKR